jgi:hypothetical protein
MGGECQVEGCERDASARGYCQMHYRRVLRTGDPGAPGPLRFRSACQVDGCDEVVDAKGLCHGHYQRVLRDSDLPVDAPLRKGRTMCKVDDCDRKAKSRGYCAAHYKRVLKHGDSQAHIPIRQVKGEGTVAHNGYRNVPVPKKLRHLTGGASWAPEHRLVMGRYLGRPLRSDEQVHHINGDRADNRIGNLELWSTSHPSGRRIEDLLEFCMTMIERYGEEFALIVPE